MPGPSDNNYYCLLLLTKGPPPPPNPTMKVIEDTLTVQWDPVFSWPEYPVIGYKVTLIRSNGQQLYNQTTHSTNISISLQQANILGANLGECEELVFSVSAINALGEGEHGNITGGLPKANGLLFISNSH